MSINDELPEAVGELTVDQALRKLGVTQEQTKDLKLLHTFEKLKVDAIREERKRFSKFQDKNLAVAYSSWVQAMQRYRQVPVFSVKLDEGFFILNQLVSLMNAYAKELDIRDDFFVLRAQQVQTQSTLADILKNIPRSGELNGASNKTSDVTALQERIASLEEENRKLLENEYLLKNGYKLDLTDKWVFKDITKKGTARLLPRPGRGGRGFTSVHELLYKDLTDGGVVFGIWGRKKVEEAK